MRGSSTQTTSASAGVAAAALDGVVQSLWGRSVAIDSSPARRRKPRARELLAVIPSAMQPRLLLPVTSRRATARALWSYRADTRRETLGRSLLSVALHRPLLLDRVYVSAGDDASSADVPGALLREHLQEILGRRDVHIAVMLNATRPPSKATLQILSRRGTVVAFAKIGWHALSRPLVANEARALKRVKQRDARLREFDVPDLIHAGPWRELEMLVVGPVSLPARRRLLNDPPLAAIDEVAGLGGSSERSTLSASRYWAGMESRLRRVDGASAPVPRAQLGPVAYEVARRFGDTELEFCSEHGEWAPWNMAHRRGRLCVWDWERSTDCSPRGLDALYFAYESDLRLRRVAHIRAIHATLAHMETVLPLVNVAGCHAPALLALHLLEVALRVKEAEATGVQTVDRRHLGALYALLEMTKSGER